MIMISRARVCVCVGVNQGGGEEPDVGDSAGRPSPAAQRDFSRRGRVQVRDINGGAVLRYGLPRGQSLRHR